jgi:hypothetical protein
LAAVTLVLVSGTSAQAQGAAAQQRLSNGGYAAWVWNRSGCSLSVDGGDNTLPAGHDGFLFLSTPVDSGRPAAGAPRRILLDGRAIANVPRDSHVEVLAGPACDSARVEAVSREKLLETVTVTTRYLEFKKGERRLSAIASGVAAVASFWAATRFAARGSSDGRIYSGLAAVGGTAFAVSAAVEASSLLSDAEAWRLKESRRATAELQRR